MRTVCLRALAAGLALIAASGCGSGGGPTAPPAGVRDITVTGTPPAPGTTASFAAKAALSDGTARDVTTIAAWTTSNPAAATITGAGLVTGIDAGETDVRASYQNVSGSAHITIPKPQCDASLWPHVYLPQRLKINLPCQTVTGVVMEQHSNDDGDIDIRVAVDAPYAHLLNAGNKTNLNGWLQTEAICQARIGANAPDAARACAGFTGSIQVPAVGDHVLVTGTYVLDTNHGWMELHPITALAVR